jgi:serine/threonine protein phosphatase PrpC
LKYTLGEHTLRGSRRINQDRIAFAERDNAVLMVLADGLGGHARGELASELLTQTIIQQFTSIRQPLIEQPSAFLALTILHSHKMIKAMGEAHKPPINPRTTCVVCLVQNGYAYWAHVGDSRLYLFRNGELVQRTQDDTMIERMRQEGVLTEEEMLTHPDKSRLLKCVGGPKEPSVSLGPETLLKSGDIILLCTDGLWEALPQETIIGYLQKGELGDAVVDLLLAAETARGGTSDNISAIAFRWDDKISEHLPLQTENIPLVDQAGLERNARHKLRHSERTVTQPQPAPAPKPPSPKKGGKPKSLGESVQSLEEELQELESYVGKIIPPKKK